MNALVVEFELRNKIIYLLGKFRGNILSVQNQVLSEIDKYVHTSTIYSVWKEGKPKCSCSVEEVARIRAVYNSANGSMKQTRCQLKSEGIDVDLGFLHVLLDDPDFLEERIRLLAPDLRTSTAISRKLSSERRKVPAGLVRRVLGEIFPEQPDSKYDHVREAVVDGSVSTYQQVADLMGVTTKEAGRQFVLREGLYDVMQRNRQAVEKRQEEEDGRVAAKTELKYIFAHLFIKYVSGVAEQQGVSWEYDRAVGFCNSRKYVRKSNLPFETVFDFFRAYRRASENGVKKSRDEFAEELGIHKNTVLRLYRSAGLKPLRGK